MKSGRFAPSPTGPLHFGSLIAAVGSFLQARRYGAAWLVRIEDIDTPRVVTGAADAILRTLEQHGLYWHGPVVYQSKRIDYYQLALDKLIAMDLVYACTCSRRDLAQLNAAAAAGGIYPGLCRNGPRKPQRKPTMRLRSEDIYIQFHDLIQGDFGQHLATEVGDFVIRRADNVFAYQLAVVVDDAEQGISDIVRGSDLLDSTPRQIYLQQLLGYPTPSYCHLPVAMNSEGDKLSKQTGAAPLNADTPAANLVAVLKFLGQQPPAELATADLTSLWNWAIQHWDIARIPALLRQPSASC
jgi:glutamyl-Q tRNA(Asp) synthetase